MTSKKRFDEAIAAGNLSIRKAHQYLTMLSNLFETIENAIKLIESGRPADARDELVKARDANAEKLT